MIPGKRICTIPRDDNNKGCGMLTAQSLVARLLICLAILLCSSCQSQNQNMTIDVQGHRGCRGLMPENTIEGFRKALDLGVTTLELDVVATKHGDVIVSHEPFFSHQISLTPDGDTIPEDQERRHNIYNMTLGEVQRYDVGTKAHPLYSQQSKIAVSKPLLSEMIRLSEVYAAEIGAKLPRYNIEIKRVPEHDGVFHPEMTVFADLVCDVIESLDIRERTTVQCFDVETLQYLHRSRPDFSLVYLIANQDGFAYNIEKLGFVPAVYSPYYKLVDDHLKTLCGDHNTLLIPWTVNELTDIEKMMEMKVDGIISDYPDRVIELVNLHQANKK